MKREDRAGEADVRGDIYLSGSLVGDGCGRLVMVRGTMVFVTMRAERSVVR